MKEFKLLTAAECADRLLEFEKPLVLMHARPDGDTVGAGIALCEIFKALGKNPVFISEDKIPKRLEFLIKDNKRAESLDGRDVVAVDVASPQQAGEILEKLPPVSLSIDHHEFGEPIADGYIAKGMSSAGEAVFDVALELISKGKLKLTKEIAYPIYAAMSSDTAGFRYSSVSSKTHEKAALLIETGIDFSDINHRLFNCKLPEQIKAEGFVSSKIKTAFGGKVAYATVTRAEREAISVPFEFFETAIDIVRSLDGVRISFIVKETDKDGFRASLRSVGEDVAGLAKKLGGGGHRRAAGCSPIADTIEDAANEILSLIKADGLIN